MAALSPRAPAAAEMLRKPLRNSEQNPDGQQQSQMASPSQWLPGNSLKTARALAKGLAFSRRVNGGAGALVTFSFSGQPDGAGTGQPIWERQAASLSPLNIRAGLLEQKSTFTRWNSTDFRG